MPSGSDSRSLFVVQRAFRRVRRGYDPEEVDRHLQLVSEWFSQGRGGRAARGGEAQLGARGAGAAQRWAARGRGPAAAEATPRPLVEAAHVEERATLEGARLRAAADIEEA